ncbi:hypothetical protein [Methylosinus sp. Ce-a6]|uniref:hypothetical protein n=1 Tax=Methylosinus sp. Ce-a6 TaxID=2172005 RepID=UPI001FCF1F1C|nr:hypothetical protein [Methylosinus sp. Ce-a6]
MNIYHSFEPFHGEPSATPRLARAPRIEAEKAATQTPSHATALRVKHVTRTPSFAVAGRIDDLRRRHAVSPHASYSAASATHSRLFDDEVRHPVESGRSCHARRTDACARSPKMIAPPERRRVAFRRSAAPPSRRSMSRWRIARGRSLFIVEISTLSRRIGATTVDVTISERSIDRKFDRRVIATSLRINFQGKKRNYDEVRIADALIRHISSRGSLGKLPMPRTCGFSSRDEIRLLVVAAHMNRRPDGFSPARARSRCDFEGEVCAIAPIGR